MKNLHVQCSLLALGLIACSCQKQNPLSELEKTADIMAESGEMAPESEPGAEEQTFVANPSEQVKSAMEDYKAGRLEDAVTRLHLLRSMTVLSPQQRMALQDSMAAVMGEIYALAEQGDPRAKAAILQYERMQTGR